MFQQLKEKLWAYIVMNNPDLMHRLQDEYGVVKYLEEKVSGVMPKAMQLMEQDVAGHAIHELCMNELTAGLKPSRYNYIVSLLSEEFEEEHERLLENGLLAYEGVNLVEYCNATFDKLHFSEESEDERPVKAAITGAIAEYFEKQSGKPGQGSMG